MDTRLSTKFVFSKSDLAVLDVFRRFLVTPGEMLCFHGPWYEEHRESLYRMTAKKMVTKEEFAGGYSLTRAGFAAVQSTGVPFEV